MNVHIEISFQWKKSLRERNIRLRLGNEEEKKHPNERGYEVESTIKDTWRTTRIWSELLRKLLTGGKFIIDAFTTDSFLAPPMKHQTN